MADYQLTQTGNEVQTILDTVGDGKFVWLDSVDTALYDGIPQAKASWFAGYYDTSWTNRPTDYGLIYMMTVGNTGVQWAYEYAIAVGGEAGQMFVRTTNNGETWSSWKKVVEEDYRGVVVTPNQSYTSDQSIACYIKNGMAFLTGYFVLKANTPATGAVLFSGLPAPQTGFVSTGIFTNSQTVQRVLIESNGNLRTDAYSVMNADWCSICICYPTND